MNARNYLAIPAPIRAALELLDASVPHTKGMSYETVYSEALGQWVLAGFEADEDGATLYEVWLRGARVDASLTAATMDCLHFELEAALRDETEPAGLCTMVGELAEAA
jgi:hypothetical protein